MGARNLITEMETLYREQKERHKDPLRNQRYQLDFYFRVPEIFRTIRKLLRRQLSVSVNTMNIGKNQALKILDVIDTFIPSFFCLVSRASKDQNKQERGGTQIYNLF